MGIQEISTEPKHPIQVVARRTGLTADLLRVWEKRYEAVSPGRSATSRRLYSDADVHRLLLLRRATLGGRRIGQVAGLSTEELEVLVATDEAAAAAAPRVPGSSRARASRDSHLAACLDAGETFEQAFTAQANSSITKLSVEGVKKKLRKRLLKKQRKIKRPRRLKMSLFQHQRLQKRPLRKQTRQRKPRHRN